MTQDVKEKAAAMHKATDIGKLIERVEAATWPDRNLDLDIAVVVGLIQRQDFDEDGKAMTAFFDLSEPSPRYSFMSGPAREVWAPGFGLPPSYTGSIDAAAALISRIAPDAEGSVDVGRSCMESDRYRASICVSGKPGVSFVGNGASPPLALLLAFLHGVEDGILRSLQSEEPRNG